MACKGYLAAVEFDDLVATFHSRVVNSGPYPIATFEATEMKGAAMNSNARSTTILLGVKKTLRNRGIRSSAT